MIALAALNDLPQGEFIRVLGGVFEHSPWVAERAVRVRPFPSRLQLLEVMRATVAAAEPGEKLALIRAHPRLRARQPGDLTPASASEQRAAGLPGCSTRESGQLERLNAAYAARFGFPFVLAVRGHTPASILAAMEARLANDELPERDTSLREIGSIAAYRLAELVSSPAAAELAAMLQFLACEPPAGAAAQVALVREWMLSAGLLVSQDGCGRAVGRATGGYPGATTMISGVYYETERRALVRESRLELLAAIAVIQALRQERIPLSSDFALIAGPHELPAACAESCIAPGESAAYVELRDLERSGGLADKEAREAISALLTAGVPGCGLVCARQRDVPERGDLGAVPGAESIERAANLWRERLLGRDRRPGQVRKVSTYD